MTEQLHVRKSGDGCILSLRVHPGAKRNAIGGMHAGALKVSVVAPAVDGRANEALMEFLAERLGLPAARISLIAGMTSRSKTVRIQGKSAAELQAALIDLC